jgi:hypothetical protein
VTAGSIGSTVDSVHRAPDHALPARLGRYAVDGLVCRQPGVLTRYAGHDRRGAVLLHVLPWIAEGTMQGRTFDQGIALRRRLPRSGLAELVDAGRFADGAWFATEPLERTLSDRLASAGPLAPEDAVAMLAPVAAALDAAHARGLVADRLGPAAVWLRQGADGKVTGVLADVGPPWPPEVRPGRLLGDVSCVAPEQIRGAAPSPAGDVYGLGVLLVWCLTGEAPFGASSRAATLQAHLEAPPPPVRDRVPGCPPALDALLGSALAKDPGARPGSAGALLGEAAASLGLAADLGPPRAPAPAAAGAGDAPAAPAQATRPGRGRLALPLLLAAPALVLIALTGYLLTRAGDRSAGVAPRAPATAARRAVAVVADLTLRPPSGELAGGPTGAVRVVRRGGRYLLTIAGAHLPAESRHPVEAYTVWLLGPGRRALRLGAIAPRVGASGRFLNHRILPAGSSRYRRIAVTRETTLGTHPGGREVLSVRFRLPAGA